MALEHFVLVVVRVLRGPTQADESAKKLRKLVHCQWCEERVFLKLGNMVDGESGHLVALLGAGSCGGVTHVSLMRFLQTRCPVTVMEVCRGRRRCSSDRCGKPLNTAVPVTVLTGTVQSQLVCVCPGAVRCSTRASCGGCCQRRCSTAWTTSSRSSKL